MPVLVACPTCSRQLRVGDQLQGRKVKCPNCQNVFLAEPAGEPEPAVPPPPPRKAPKPPPRRDPDEEVAGRPDRGRVVGHRGAVVLVLGILATLIGVVALLLICF